MRSFFGLKEGATEATPLNNHGHGAPLEMDDQEDDFTLEEKGRLFDRQARAADRLSMRLLQVHTDEEERDILKETLGLESSHHEPKEETKEHFEFRALSSFLALLGMALLVLSGLACLLLLGAQFVGPPNQPIGPYRLLERQEGHDFFEYYNYYQGRDSAGSNGFNTYVSAERAIELGIVNITMEKDILDLTSNSAGRRRRTTDNATLDEEMVETEHDLLEDAPTLKDEPFIYMSSASTADGPRESIRLEGKRRFNRGLFIIDLRHMPAGCGVWPAFWLADEANWPVNGEIDIVEGVNYQNEAKTALHATIGCSMDDVPQGVMTGGWDTAVGIPDSKTGIPDTTLRYAMDCFVYNPKQWLNQGCVAVDMEGGSLGIPLNKKGGGVYALEWDPVNRHMRTWVFTPHVKVPKNLQEAISTASQPHVNDRVMPDPELWPLPYGYFPIGDETSCPSMHFKDMRLVFNLAFCGSVAGNRYQLDCPVQSKSHQTCNDWIATDPEELKEAYWKIRGVYVYEREWERAWL